MITLQAGKYIANPGQVPGHSSGQIDLSEAAGHGGSFGLVPAMRFAMLASPTTTEGNFSVSRTGQLDIPIRWDGMLEFYLFPICY